MVEFKDKEAFRLSRPIEEREKDKRKVFGVSLNLEEIQMLKDDMKLLAQSKPSTAFKQIWEIGHFVIHHDKIGKIMAVRLANLRRNERIGLIDVEAEIEANVKQI